MAPRDQGRKLGNDPRGAPEAWCKLSYDTERCLPSCSETCSSQNVTVFAQSRAGWEKPPRLPAPQGGTGEMFQSQACGPRRRDPQAASEQTASRCFSCLRSWSQHAKQPAVSLVTSDCSQALRSVESSTQKVQTTVECR